MTYEGRRKKVIFICAQNSARSQMAEGFLKSLYKDRYEAFSAGVEPTYVHPYAIKVMDEVGIDISNHRSKSVYEFAKRDMDLAITVCDKARENCPFFPAKKILNKPFSDPAAFRGSENEKLDEFRRIRDEIKTWIEQFFGTGEVDNEYRQTSTTVLFKK